jgi:hypothetical protein
MADKEAKPSQHPSAPGNRPRTKDSEAPLPSVPPRAARRVTASEAQPPRPARLTASTTASSQPAPARSRAPINQSSTVPQSAPSEAQRKSSIPVRAPTAQRSTPASPIAARDSGRSNRAPPSSPIATGEPGHSKPPLSSPKATTPPSAKAPRPGSAAPPRPQQEVPRGPAGRPRTPQKDEASGHALADSDLLDAEEEAEEEPVLPNRRVSARPPTLSTGPKKPSLPPRPPTAQHREPASLPPSFPATLVDPNVPAPPAPTPSSAPMATLPSPAPAASQPPASIATLPSPASIAILASAPSGSPAAPTQVASAPELPPPISLIDALARRPVTPESQALEIPIADELGDPPPAKRLGGSHKRLWLLAGMGVILAVVAIVLSTRSTTGMLVVTVADPSGAPVEKAEISVDGQQRCSASPCRLEDLERGLHAVRVAAAGYQKSAEQKAEVEPGGRTHLSVALMVQPPPAPPAPAAAVEPEPAPAPHLDSAKSDERPKPSSVRSGPASAKAHKGSTPTSDEHETGPVTDLTSSGTSAAGTGKGYLTITSRPSGMVYLDGRPLGPTPRQTSLPAGRHTVTVENPDYGKQTVKIMIQAGKSSSLMLDL